VISAVAGLPPLSDLLTAGQSALYRLCGPPAAASSGFHAESPPYLWASEFPARALASLRATLAPPVLCIAGSGDNAVELLALKLSPLVAVDVSRPACYVSEIKAAALAAGLALTDYLRLLPSPPVDLLARLTGALSPEAAAFWRQAAECGGVEPASLLERVPDRAHLAYLASEAAFEQARAAVRRWPLVNLALEDYLARTPHRFGTIYVSNVGEYVRRAALLSGGEEADAQAKLRDLWRLVARHLLPGGVALAYAFESREAAQRGAEAAAMAAAGLRLAAYPLEFSRLGGRLRHCVLAGRAP